MVSLNDLCVQLPVQAYIAAVVFAINVIVMIVILATVRRREEEAEALAEESAAVGEGAWRSPVWGVPYLVPCPAPYPAQYPAAYPAAYPTYALPAAPALAQEAEEADTEQSVPYAEYAAPVEEASPTEAVAQPVISAPISAPVYEDRPSAQAEEQGFYQGDDEFLKTLNEAEYFEFVDSFVNEKSCKELPDYTVGAKNAEFFSKFFLYLHKTRLYISDGLLGKIYQHTVKRRLIAY